MAFDWKEWTGPAALLAIAGGLFWLGALDQRVRGLEEAVSKGARDTSCENIANRIGVAVERNDMRSFQDLMTVGERFGCVDDPDFATTNIVNEAQPELEK